MVWKITYLQLAELIISTQDYSDRVLKLDSTKWFRDVFGLGDKVHNNWITDPEQIRKIQYKYYSQSPGWSLIGVQVWSILK